MRGRAFVLAAMLIGCAPRGPLDIGYRGSDTGYVDALIAADAWNQACGVELVRMHRGEGDIRLSEQEGETSGATGETTIERPVLGTFGEKRATSIWFTSGDYALPTLAHEFGHALGLGHAPAGVMRPGGQWDALDPTTDRRSLVPGLISADDCARVAR